MPGFPEEWEPIFIIKFEVQSFNTNPLARIYFHQCAQVLSLSLAACMEGQKLFPFTSSASFLILSSQPTTISVTNFLLKTSSSLCFCCLLGHFYSQRSFIMSHILCLASAAFWGHQSYGHLDSGGHRHIA